MKIDIIPASAVQSSWMDAVISHCWGVRRKASMDRYYQSNDSVTLLLQYLALCRAPRSVALQIRTHEKKTDAMCGWNQVVQIIWNDST